MTQEALKLAIQLRDTASGYWTEHEIPIIEKLIELLAKEKALQALHNENERLGLYKDAYAEQEPVAWQLWVGADTPLNAPMGWLFYSTYDSLRSAEISARTINSYQQAPFAKIVPLYTTPPQRKPLTDEQVREIAKQYALGLAFPYDSQTTPEMFARAIEQAHGITGEKK